MAFVLADRVKETSTTTGTGTYDLAGAVTGFQTFVAGIGNGNTCWYFAENGTDWEVGVGTVTDAATDTLARTTILASSNAGAAVNWGAGTKTLGVGLPASKISPLAIENGGTGASTATLGFAALAAEAISFGGVITPAALTGNVNDYAPTGFSTCSIVRLDADADSYNITGLAGGAANRSVFISNIGTFYIDVHHEDAASSAANRFHCPGSTNWRVPPRGGILVIYDGTLSRWKLYPFSQGPADGTVQEAASSFDSFVSPAFQNRHPSAAKGWVKCDAAAGINASYNVTSITDGGTGIATVNWATDFSSANYCVCATPFKTSAAVTIRVDSQAAGTTRVDVFITSPPGNTDPTAYMVAAFGDQ